MRFTCSVSHRNLDEDSGKVLDEFVGPGLQLMEQSIQIEGEQFNLIVPKSSDSVIDFYINSGTVNHHFQGS